MKPQNFEEKVVWYCLIGTYVLYFLGALFIVIPIMAWVLVLYLGKKIWEQTEDTPLKQKIIIHRVVWIWIVSMLLIQVALIVGHLDFDLGIMRTVKSSINFFARSWALFALFPLIGHLNIRPQLICRAVCIVCLQSLVLIPLFLIAAHLHLPRELYVSPLRRIGGVGTNPYAVNLYRIDSGRIRLYLFAPWAPAMGFVSNVYFFLACLEPNKKWRRIGVIGAVVMAVVTISRAAIVCLMVVPFLTWLLVNITQPSVQITTGIGSFLVGLFGTKILSWLEDFQEFFRSQRANSSRTREILAQWTVERWKTEAPIWGHGINEPTGITLTAGLPIGTHHTWFSVLFNHGIVGFTALAVPLLWTFLELLVKAQNNLLARAALGITIVIFLFSFVENVDGLTYLYWPGLVMIGIALKTSSVTVSSLKLKEINA